MRSQETKTRDTIMLQAIRNGVKSPLMKIFLLFLVAGFALWGIGDGTTGLIGGSDKAISAGDESISPGEVAVEFDRTRRNYLPDSTTGEALESGLLSELAGVLARDVVFRAEASSLGLTVTTQMQREAVTASEVFQDSAGNFSPSRFRTVLSNAGFSEGEYLERLDTDLRRQQIVGAIGAGVGLPESVVETLTRFELERRTAKLVPFDIDADSIRGPSHAVLSAWFDDNRALFDAPRLRTVRVGIITAAKYAESVDIPENEIRIAYGNRLDEFQVPEQRRIRQMVFDDQEAAEDARRRLDDGEDFDDVARDTRGWTPDDTGLGLVTREELGENLGAAAFDAEDDGIAGPVESPFGFHLLSIDEIVAESASEYDDVRDDILASLQEEGAIEVLYDRVNTLEDLIASGESINEAIARVDGDVFLLEQIDRRGDDINGEEITGDSAELVQDSLVLDTIWSEPVGETGVIQETTDDGFFVVEVLEESEARSRTLDEVEGFAVARWQTQQATAAARALAQSAIDGDGFDDVEATPDFRRNGSGLDHEAGRLIADAVFAQDVGDADVVETESQVIAVRTDSVVDANRGEVRESARVLTDVLGLSMQQDVIEILSRDLSQKHDLQVRLGRVQQLLVGQN